MSKIPGLDDDDDMEIGTDAGPIDQFSKGDPSNGKNGIIDFKEEVPTTSRSSGIPNKRSIEMNGDEQNSKRIRSDEVADEDLYGDTKTVKGLKEENLPVTYSDFLQCLLSIVPSDQDTKIKLSDQAERVERTYREMSVMDTVETMQVWYVATSIHEIMKRLMVKETQQLDEFQCYTLYENPDDKWHEINALLVKDLETPNVMQSDLKKGTLCRITIFEEGDQEGETVTFNDVYGFVQDSAVRSSNPTTVSVERLILSKAELVPDQTLIEDVLLQILALKKWPAKRMFHLNVTPICFVGDILRKLKNIYRLSSSKMNILFNYLVKREFHIPISGYNIDSDPSLFSSSQLEAIQRAVDLLHIIRPKDPKDNGFYQPSILCIKGSDKRGSEDKTSSSVKTCVVEILNQFLKNDNCKNVQFILISGSTRALLNISHTIRRTLKMSPDHVFNYCENNEARYIRYAKDFIEMDIKKFSDDIKHMEQDNAPHHQQNLMRIKGDLSRLEQSHRLITMKLGGRTHKLSSSEPNTDFIGTSVCVMDDFMNHAKDWHMNNAKIMMGTPMQFHRDKEKRLRKVNFEVVKEGEEQDPRARKNKVTSNLVIVDGTKLRESDLLALYAEDRFVKFVVTSSWGDNEALEGCLIDALENRSKNSSGDMFVNITD